MREPCANEVFVDTNGLKPGDKVYVLIDGVQAEISGFMQYLSLETQTGGAVYPPCEGTHTVSAVLNGVEIGSRTYSDVPPTSEPPNPSTGSPAPEGSPHGSAANQPGNWKSWLVGQGYANVSCAKTDNLKQKTWTVGGGILLLVLKGGTVNEVVWSPASGVPYGLSSGKNLSHVITCEGMTGSSPTPSESPSPTPTETPTETPTQTPTETPTESPTGTPTETPSETPTESPTESPSPTPTESPTQTPTETPSETPTQTPSQSPTPTPTPTETPSPSPTPSDTPSPTPTGTSTTSSPSSTQSTQAPQGPQKPKPGERSTEARWPRQSRTGGDTGALGALGLVGGLVAAGLGATALARRKK